MNLSPISELIKTLPNRLLVKRNIFIVVAVVIVAELVWVYRSLGPIAPVVPAPKVLPQTTKAVSSPSTISLKTSTSLVKVGERVVVSVDMASSKATDGTDLVILYDPKLLSVVPVAGKQVMKVNSLYSDYPVNSDDGNGRITVSGISTQSGGVVPKGVFGTLTFQAKGAGVAKISLDFTPDSTTDSNIIEARSANDILSSVENLEVRITP